MGLIFVLGFWAIAGSILASLAAVGTRIFALAITRQIPRNPVKRRLIRAATILPIACLLWAACVFVFQAVINSVYLNRDVGTGDTWNCPLPNGYEIMMIDVTEEGTVYKPRTQTLPYGVTGQEDSVFGVRTLQVAGPWLLGGADTESFSRLDEEGAINRYFLLDTRTGKPGYFKNQADLQSAAQHIGVRLQLEPIDTVYNRYRFTWFDLLALLLLLIPPAAATLLLLRALLHLRKSAAKSPCTLSPAP